MRWQQVGGAALAVSGVALIGGRLFGHGGILAFWGAGWASSSASAARARPFSNVLLKRRALAAGPGDDRRLANGLRHRAVALVRPDRRGQPAPLPLDRTLAIFCPLCLAIIGSALTFLLLYWLLPRIPVNKLQTISLITPPGAVMFGYLIGGETFSLWSLVGGAFVLAGVWMIFRKAEPTRERVECEAAMRRA